MSTIHREEMSNDEICEPDRKRPIHIVASRRMAGAGKVVPDDARADGQSDTGELDTR